MKEEKQDKVEKAEEEDNKEDEAPLIENKKLFILIAVILGIILALFSLKFFLKPKLPFPHYTYNGFEFYQYGGLWNTQWQRGDKLFDVHIRYGPREAEDVSFYAGPDVTFNPGGKLYLTHDPRESGLGYVALASAEISFTLSQVFNVTPIAACAQNITDACGTRPIVNCETNPENAVIYLKEIEDPSQTAIALNGNCMIIQGNKEELVRAADKVIWVWYGIIK